MAYFDNAATTYPKPECVYSFMDEFYRSNGGSAGRGNYQLAFSAKGLIDDTRKRVSKILHPYKTSYICAIGHNSTKYNNPRCHKKELKTFILVHLNTML